jgi:hypothetical protein
MGISLSTDIVLDVARAADPAKHQAASKRLADMSGSTSGAEFAAMLNGIGGQSAVNMPSDHYALNTAPRHETALSADTKKDKAAQQLEAFVLQSFVDSMLPKDSESVFGKGTAGGIWKSMLAEQIGAQIARTGGVGIAKQVLAAQAFVNLSGQDDLAVSTAGPSAQTNDRS